VGSNKTKHKQELKRIATALGRFQHSLAFSNIRETTTTHVKPKEEKPVQYLQNCTHRMITSQKA
jgi:hypothetical protein